MIALCNRNIDGNGMDVYDRQYGISGPGLTRSSWGAIYKDGEYDFWSNLLDHNPYYNY